MFYCLTNFLLIMLKNNLGYPRIGSHRELKKASEQYWAGKISLAGLREIAKEIRTQNWETQLAAGIDLIPCNDFSYYDQVLDMSMLLGIIPERYTAVLTTNSKNTELDLYFAMARGYQKDGLDIKAMEMTKWFDTNYHYIVPEFKKEQEFKVFSNNLFHDFFEAKLVLDKAPKPVLIGPVSFLMLGKEKEEGFHKLNLLPKLLPVYIDILNKLKGFGAEWVQMDEPFLAMDLDDKMKSAFQMAYEKISKESSLKILLTTYFEALRENTSLAVNLPVCALHIDLAKNPEQLDEVLENIPEKLSLSLGIVDGRNIWKNDYTKSLSLIEKAKSKIGEERLMIAPSCSLLHVPYDLDLEKKEDILSPEVKNWMAFAKQKLQEIHDLYQITEGNTNALKSNQKALESRSLSALIHKPEIKERVKVLREEDSRRKSPFQQRQIIQQTAFNLPYFPTTTIGSFPQTDDIRQLRAKFKKGEINQEQYEKAIEEATESVIRWQEQIGLDVLVHGEYERNDMVEYFGELLNGFVFTQNGWVQSYGSRCVKPPVIYGDVNRLEAMTVRWSTYAQSLTDKLMKGMLTGPVTILQWSFVRDDQPRSLTCMQIALAIRDEVQDLEKAGIKVIQIDEPAIREGLPLRKVDWDNYLDWAVKAFRVSSSGVNDGTQIHTHMCYSEFNDIIKSIADMDADVITIETSRSQMELLEAFSDFAYPNEIGPGVYDIHSPRIPTVEEMFDLLEKAAAILPGRNIWANPDCGLKTRKWPETEAALKNMVKAAQKLRKKVSVIY